VNRHGCYKADLEEFAKALMVKRSAPLFAQPAATDAPVEASAEEKSRTRKSKNKITVIVKERPTDPPPGVQP